jgi:hypothetical protein
MKTQSAATIRKILRKYFQARSNLLSSRLNIYKTIASAAPEVQEEVIAEVCTLNAEGLGKQKKAGCLCRRRKKNENEEGS